MRGPEGAELLDMLDDLEKTMLEELGESHMNMLRAKAQERERELKRKQKRRRAWVDIRDPPPSNLLDCEFYSDSPPCVFTKPVHLAPPLEKPWMSWPGLYPQTMSDDLEKAKAMLKKSRMAWLEARARERKQRGTWVPFRHPVLSRLLDWEFYDFTPYVIIIKPVQARATVHELATQLCETFTRANVGIDITASFLRPPKDKLRPLPKKSTSNRRPNLRVKRRAKAIHYQACPRRQGAIRKNG
jgi:hypothetical protein